MRTQPARWRAPHPSDWLDGPTAADVEVWGCGAWATLFVRFTKVSAGARAQPGPGSGLQAPCSRLRDGATICDCSFADWWPPDQPERRNRQGVFGSMMRGVCFFPRTPTSSRLEAALMESSCSCPLGLYLPFCRPALWAPPFL